ncbi:MAG: response regulator [Planctomycetes bacterium]|nr:response regulator [Planctomycetota bacterium]
MSSLGSGERFHVLLVDDNPGDVHLVKTVLKENEPRVQLTIADDGAQAIQRLRESPALPDLVLTDLMMPNMDGLQLVEQIRRHYPAVPVILMTAYGTEAIALEALQKGAASYVPKKSLPTDLPGTLRQVLQVARGARERGRVLECLEVSESRFVLDNDPSLVPPLIGYLQENLRRLMLCDEGEQIRVSVAIHEALMNAMFHGNLEVGSVLREKDDRDFAELTELRRTQMPYQERRVHVTTRQSRSEAVYVVQDEGPGFDPSILPDPTDPENLQHVSGRGLLLIRTFMDEVFHNERGNEITMIKRHQPVVLDGT